MSPPRPWNPPRPQTGAGLDSAVCMAGTTLTPGARRCAWERGRPARHSASSGPWWTGREPGVCEGEGASPRARQGSRASQTWAQMLPLPLTSPASLGKWTVHASVSSSVMGDRGRAGRVGAHVLRTCLAGETIRETPTRFYLKKRPCWHRLRNHAVTHSEYTRVSSVAQSCAATNISARTVLSPHDQSPPNFLEKPS